MKKVEKLSRVLRVCKEVGNWTVAHGSKYIGISIWHNDLEKIERSCQYWKAPKPERVEGNGLYHTYFWFFKI